MQDWDNLMRVRNFFHWLRICCIVKEKREGKRGKEGRRGEGCDVLTAHGYVRTC